MNPILEYSVRWIENVNNSDLSADIKKEQIDWHIQEVKNQLSLIF